MASSPARTLNGLQPWTLCLLRITLGLVMLYNGWDKVIPAGGPFHHPLAAMSHFAAYVVTLGMPGWLGYVSALTEFVGGLLLIIGLLTRFAALMVAGNMLVALVKVNLHHGFPGSQFTLCLIAIALVILTTGSGALSLDRRLGLS